MELMVGMGAARGSRMPSHRPAFLVLLVVFPLAFLAGCSCGSSHVRDDAGADARAVGDGGCLGAGPMYCVSSCGSDAGVLPVCIAGGWQCPPGTIDASTCPPTCWGPPPGDDCSCDTTASPPRYICSDECPAGIEPWNPDSPGNACAPEGRECASGGSVCGAGMFCQCASGRWSCAVAEPDPACYCGREPAEGSPCVEEGMLCGSCCPTPGSPAFGPFTCVGGRWTINDCPAECPPIAEPPCPADRPLGLACPLEGQLCGNPCCDAIQCTAGVWGPGPEVGCACDPSSVFTCGTGSCTADRACASHCGPADGIEHSCLALPTGCHSCDCAPVDPGVICEEREGHVFLREAGFCG